MLFKKCRYIYIIIIINLIVSISPPYNLAVDNTDLNSTLMGRYIYNYVMGGLLKRVFNKHVYNNNIINNIFVYIFNLFIYIRVNGLIKKCKRK